MTLKRECLSEVKRALIKVQTERVGFVPPSSVFIAVVNINSIIIRIIIYISNCIFYFTKLHILLDKIAQLWFNICVTTKFPINAYNSPVFLLKIYKGEVLNLCNIKASKEKIEPNKKLHRDIPVLVIIITNN